MKRKEIFKFAHFNPNLTLFEKFQIAYILIQYQTKTVQI